MTDKYRPPKYWPRPPVNDRLPVGRDSQEGSQNPQIWPAAPESTEASKPHNLDRSDTLFDPEDLEALAAIRARREQKEAGVPDEVISEQDAQKAAEERVAREAAFLEKIQAAGRDGPLWLRWPD